MGKIMNKNKNLCEYGCEKCHYEKGHNDECSTGNLSKIICSVESQKFLNQKL